MPEWNLVVAQKTKRVFSLTTSVNRSAVVCCLFAAALVLTTQAGCSKIRSGGLDRNILRSGNNTVPSQQSQPVSTTPRFANDPSKALLELNDAYEKFELNPASETESLKPELDKVFEDIDQSQSLRSDAKILEVSQQSFDTQQKGITLVAVQPPAPSIKNSFAVSQGSSSVNIDKVLLGGVPLSEIEPINPANSPRKCDDAHADCDCMKEKLKPLLPYAQPVQPPAISSQAPPSELVSQPLAPIMFDQATREVQDYDQQHTKQNALRVLGQQLVAKAAPLKEKIETQIAPEPLKFVQTESRPVQFYPVVDPDLGRAIKSSSNCVECDSLACIGECKATKRRSDANRLRPVVASEQIPLVTNLTTQEIVATDVKRAPIAIKGEFVPAPKALPLAKVNYSEFTTQDWTDIFGPPEVPVKVQPQVQLKHRRSELIPKLQVVPPPLQEVLVEASENQFQPSPSNDFLPIQQNVELAVAEVVTEGAKWEPPKHTNFSPIPNGAGAQELTKPAGPSLALAKAASRGNDALFPVVDTRVKVPAKPEVVIEIVDNTVPWSVKLAETVDNVRGQLKSEHDPRTRNGIEVNLRLLEVLQRQMETVEENRHSMPNSELQYWQHQLDAITLMLPATNNGVSDLDRHNTAYETLEHLRKAVERLESIAELKVNSGRFCTEISGFGKYKPFANTVFKPGQKTLVYCEVENYQSNARVVNSDQSYLTRLRGSYVIYDGQGRVVQQSEYPVVDDVARKKRRDFYMYFPIQIGELAVGNYKLELMVEDLSSNKTAALKPGMAFQVR